MAEEVGVAFVRLVPSMRGFSSEAQQALTDALTDPARRAGQNAGRQASDGFSAALRRGADDAGQDAGRVAGDSLGDALRRGADDAGQDAGREVGDGLAAGADGPAADAGQATAGRFGAAFKAGLAGVAVAGAALLVHGFTQALDEGRITARMGAQLGVTAEEAEHYGHLAGDLYADAVVADFQSAADTIRAVFSAGLIPKGATDAQVKEIATGVADLANVFEFDLGEAATAVGQLIKNGMAPDAKTGLDLLAEGLKGTDQRADDALETITEYGTQFKLLGLNGQEAMGLIRQGLQAGAMDTDKIADAFKEFQLRAVTDAEPVQEAFKTLGLDGQQMGADIGAGGDRARDAMDQVLDELRKMPQSAERAMVVQELFGGPGEDLGAALFALDVDKAATSLDGMGGSAERMGETLRDSAGTKVDQFKRRMEQGLVTFLGDHVIPVIEEFAHAFGPTFRDIGQAASTFWSEVQPALSGFKTLVGEVLSSFTSEDGTNPMSGLFGNPADLSETLSQIAQIITDGVALIQEIWNRWGDEIMTAVGIVWATVGGYVSSAMTFIQGVIQVVSGIISGDWEKVWNGVWKIFSGLWGMMLSLVVGALALMGQSIWMGLQFIGDVISTGWDWVTRKTGEAWDWLTGKISEAMDSASRWVSDKIDTIKREFDEVKTKIQDAFSGAKGWLYGAGQSIIQGLVDGLWSMVGYLGDTMGNIGDWAMSYWPFSPAKRGPLRSKPPEMWGANVGHLVAEGLRSSVSDIAGASDLAAATAELPTAAIAAPSHPAAPVAAGTTVVIDGTGLPDPLLEWLRNAIRVQSGGDVAEFFNQA